MNSLPVMDIAGEAYGFVWRAWQGVMRIGWPFALALWALLIVTAFGFGDAWLLAVSVASVGQLVLTAGFSYYWYRVVLLGPGAGPGDTAVRMRYWGRYAVYMLVPVAASVLGALLALSAGGSASAGQGGGSIPALFLIALMAGTVYVMIRLIFVLPSTAAGVATTWRTVWEQTSGKALPLFLLMMLQVVPFYVVNLVIDAVTAALFAGTVGTVVNTLLMTVSWLAGTAVLVSMIGMAFWTLTGLPGSGAAPAVPED
jgi:hypothetical protein